MRRRIENWSSTRAWENVRVYKRLFLLLILIPSVSFSAGTAVGKIKGYVLTENGVYVSSEGASTNGPACNTTDRFFFPYGTVHEKAFLASILSAFAQGTSISLNGTGDCNGGNAEILRKICVVGVPC